MRQPELGRFVPKSYQFSSEQDEARSPSLCNQPWCWWNPRQNSMFVTFSDETSIHGLKFLGQQKRHCSERVFWLISFLASFATAVWLIYEVWDRYEKAPVIVSLQPGEQDMDSLPFPAVTICNMNKFPKSIIRLLERNADNPIIPERQRKKWRRELGFIRNVCNAQQSFAKRMGFAQNRGKVKRRFSYASSGNESINEDETQMLMTDFLIDRTIHCEDLIRLCVFEKHQYKNCSELFKPVITDYGKCCTFNIMPLPLLFNNPQKAGDPKASPYDNPVLGKNGIETWPQQELDLWNKWNYDKGFVMEDPNMKRPWRQHRAGLPYGLSILLDPNVDEYFCPASDSFGVRYILHNPVELPHVTEFSSVAHLDKEILIEVHPDVTNADDDIRNIDYRKRQCYFGKEKNLRYFGPYTGGNCVDECMARELSRVCGCSQFYMPRDTGIRVCDTTKNSLDYNCTKETRANIIRNVKAVCSECAGLCEEVVYNYETTIAALQNSSQLWADPSPEYHNENKPEWANHRMSVVHIFFGAESTVPKYRKRLYGITDLIANTGAILGLCLGFSILSGVEFIYFLTIRSFWTFCRKRNTRKQMQRDEQSANNAFAQMLFQRPPDKKLQIHPNLMRGTPRELNSNLFAPYKTARGLGNPQGHHFYDSTSFHQKPHTYGNVINMPPQPSSNFWR